MKVLEEQTIISVLQVQSFDPCTEDRMMLLVSTLRPLALLPIADID